MIISNKTRHEKMAARAVCNKNHIAQEKEKTLMFIMSLVLTSLTLTPTLSVFPLYSTFSVIGVLVVHVWSPLLFPVIIVIISKINHDRPVGNKTKNDDHFYFYVIGPLPHSSDIIRYSTSPYCKQTLVNTSMQ